jgi:hypothetical protein
MSSPVTKYLQPRYELVVGILGHFALLFGFPGRNAEALGRWFLAVPLERVAACKEISTVVAEIDLEWVRLCGFTVTLEAVPCVQSSFGADSALDLFHCPAGPVGLRGLSPCACPCCCSTTPPSTLPSSQISRPSAPSAHPCGNLGPSNGRR